MNYSQRFAPAWQAGPRVDPSQSQRTEGRSVLWRAAIPVAGHSHQGLAEGLVPSAIARLMIELPCCCCLVACTYLVPVEYISFQTHPSSGSLRPCTHSFHILYCTAPSPHRAVHSSTLPCCTPPNAVQRSTIRYHTAPFPLGLGQYTADLRADSTPRP